MADIIVCPQEPPSGDLEPKINAVFISGQSVPPLVNPPPANINN